MDTQKQQNKINILYGILIVSTVLSFVPEVTLQIFSFILLALVLIFASYYKKTDKVDGLLYNHMTYMIGTIWIGSAMLLLGMIAGGIWVHGSADNSAFDAMMAQVEGGNIPTAEDLKATAASYMEINKRLLITSTIVTVGPGVLYIIYRVATGMSRAYQGYRIANPKSWL